MIITIDGTPAAGKTTMAKLLAEHYNLTHLDSGALFRTITYYCLNNGVDLSDEKQVVKQLRHIHIALKQDDVILNGINVTSIIRIPDVTKNVCRISNIPALRSFVKNYQKTSGKKGNVICDGRKVGIEVFPYADKKFFLTADLRTRATRRYWEYRKKNIDTEFDTVYADLAKREHAEIKNGILIKPEDAIVIDNSHLSIDELLEIMISYIEQ